MFSTHANNRMHLTEASFLYFLLLLNEKKCLANIGSKNQRESQKERNRTLTQ